MRVKYWMRQQLRNTPSVAELNQLYSSAAITEILPGATTRNNQERRGNLNWQYAAEIMREEKRRRITAA